MTAMNQASSTTAPRVLLVDDHQLLRQAVRRALEDAGIAVHDVATSSFRITWMIPRTRLEDAVRTLHALFIP